MRSARRLSVYRVGLMVGAAALVVAVATMASSPSVRAEEGAFSVVAHLPASPHLDLTGTGTAGQDTVYHESSFLLDVAARRGYELGGFLEAGKAFTEISVVDLDGLRILARRTIVGALPLAYGSDQAQQGYVAALETGSTPRLVFVAGTGSTAVPYGDLAIIDLTTFTLAGSVTLQSPSSQCFGAFPKPCSTFGIGYDGRTGLLYALFATNAFYGNGLFGVGKYSLSVAVIDVAKQTVVAIGALPALCEGPPTDALGSAANEDPAPVFRSTDGASIWTACVINRNSGTGGTVGAVQLPVDQRGYPAATPSPTVYPGVPYIEDAYADPAADRIVFRNNVAGDHNLIVFDGRHRRYVGLAALDKAPSASGSPTLNGNGLDQGTGRYYFASLFGIFSVDGRRTDRNGFPQANVIPPDGKGRQGGLGIASDPVGHHVFVLWKSDKAFGASTTKLDSYYTVYKDNIPVSSDTPLSSLDTNTSDVPASASTLQIYSGYAQGFGLRQMTLAPADIGGYGAGASTGDVGGIRDILHGVAANTILTGNGAQASGYTVAVDNRTRSEYPSGNPPDGLPSLEPTPSPSPSASPVAGYPYAVVACHDTTHHRDTLNRDDPGGSTSVTCDLSNADVGVHSTMGPTVATQSDAPTASVASAEITTDVDLISNLSSKMGTLPAIVSKATATVHGIVLAPDVVIDTVTLSVSAVAAGRHDTATTTISRTISGVTAGSYHCDSSCAPGLTIEKINEQLQTEFPGQIQLVVPSADPTAAAGTPHGYYSAVFKDSYDFLNDGVLNLDLRPELVGLEEIRNNDAVFVGQQARQIVEFGGVEVESRYGITTAPADLSNTDLAGVLGGNGALGNGVLGPGVLPAPITTAPPAAPPSGVDQTPRGRIIAALRSVLNGLSAFVDVHQLPLMAAVWTILVLPAYLATRRKRLERFGL